MFRVNKRCTDHFFRLRILLCSSVGVNLSGEYFAYSFLVLFGLVALPNLVIENPCDITSDCKIDFTIRCGRLGRGRLTNTGLCFLVNELLGLGNNKGEGLGLKNLEGLGLGEGLLEGEGLADLLGLGDGLND